MNIDEIKELRELKKKKEEIEEKANTLTVPIVTDLSLIPTIYEYFWEIMESRYCPPVRELTMQRKKFLFIIINFYCPKYFGGAKMSKGLREELSKLFEYSSPSAISDLCHSIVNQYLIYKTIRQDISDLVDNITEKLQENNLL